MSEDLLLIHELAGLAGTTVRTVRYYTIEGLLPPPIVQGKYAYYTLNHLYRLDLIRRMKDAYLPLREIRSVMRSLSDDEVCKRLMETSSESGATSSEKVFQMQSVSEDGSSALDYIDQLLDKQSAHRPPRQASPAPQQAPVSGEAWQRIPLAPGVELHISQPAAQQFSDRVQQLIIFAQKLFR